MSIHASTRAMFEHVMLRMVEKIQCGEDHTKLLTTLLDCYNNASADCEKLLAKVNELKGR